MDYLPDWKSLRMHATPQWFRDAKFGIYTHWGVYCVPATGPNATWYPYNMYREGMPQYEHHLKTYGGPAKFGYKDFIPMLTGEKFDPNEWAELFKRAGARFAGPVAQHHDGFAMWDSQYTEWNAARMGPHRDVVGELSKAIKGQGMRFLTAFHHAENWWFFPHWKKEYDTSDPKYAGLYGPAHNLQGPISDTWFFNQDLPNKFFLDRWKNEIFEVVDKYEPDMLWYDFGIRGVQEDYRKEMLAYFYNKEKEWGRELVVTYKDYDLLPGSATLDLEWGRMDHLTYMDWITDTSVDDEEGWGYVKNAKYKTTAGLVHYLVDNVSKNGYLLLNVGPMADGQIPPQAKALLEGIGSWLAVNGEAIYDTTPWTTYGEGPTQMEKSGGFSEHSAVQYTPQDVRYTANGSFLYATCLGWPTEKVILTSLAGLYPGEVRSVSMLGCAQPLQWQETPAGLEVIPPDEKPCEHAFVFKIERGKPF